MFSIFQNYNSLDVDEPAKFVLGKNHKTSNAPSDGSLVSDIERMMMKHMETLMHAIDNLSSRLSQLETKTRNIEHSIDDLKMSVGNNHGAIDGKMRLLENILTEVSFIPYLPVQAYIVFKNATISNCKRVGRVKLVR